MVRNFIINEDGSILRFGQKISIDELTIEECIQIMQNKSFDTDNIEKINKRYLYLVEEQKRLTPQFITKDAYFKLNPNIKNIEISRCLVGLAFSLTILLISIFLGICIDGLFFIATAIMAYIVLFIILMFAFLKERDDNVYEIEDTESEIKIVKSQTSSMGLARFTGEKYSIANIPVHSQVSILNYGDGTYLVTTIRIGKKGSITTKKGLINYLKKCIWILPLQECDIRKFNDNIIIEKKDGTVIKMTTRGFIVG